MGVVERTRAAREGGFSIVEVLVAVSILVVITAATAGVIMQSLEAIRGNTDRVQAAAIARTKLAQLKALGADAVAPNGQSATTSERNFGGSDFTVTTVSRWVGFDEDTNPCGSVVGGSPANGYVQTRIAVEGGELAGPQFIDAVIPPTVGVPESTGGAVTVYVRGENGQPLSGWQVTASSSAVGAVGQQGTSGADGCIHFSRLVPGAWQFDLVLPSTYMVQPGTTATRSVPVLSVGENVAVDPYVAALPVGGITLTAGKGPRYAIAPKVPVVVSLGALGQVSRFMPGAGFTVPDPGQRLWPDPLGYSARLGCADSGSPTTLAVSPGAVTTTELPTALVDIVGPKGSAVTIRHAAEAGGTGLCSGTAESLGALVAADDPAQPDAATGPSGRLGVALPPGKWTVSVPGESDKVISVVASQNCSVYWPPPAEPAPSPSASASATPSGSTGPTSSASPSGAAATLPAEMPAFDLCAKP